MPKLLRVEKSSNPKKKWDFFFEAANGRTVKRSVGDSSMEDYTQHHDTNRRANYRQRHAKDLDTKDPTRPGYISYYVLWGDSTSFQENLRSYKRRFGL